MGGALGWVVMGCDVVNGGGEASDGGGPKITSSTGVEGNRMHCTVLCPDRCDRSNWQKAPGCLKRQFRFACLMGEQLYQSWP